MSIGVVARQSLIYTLSTWAGRFFTILSTPILTRILTPEDYGIVDFIATLEAAAILIVSGGIDAGFRRYYIDTKDEAKRHAYLGTGYVVWGALNITLIVMVFLNAEWIAGSLIGDSTLAPVVQVAAFAMLGNMARRMTTEILRDNMQVRVVAFTSVVTLVIRLTLSIVFVAGLMQGVVGLYYATIVATGSMVLVEIFVIRRYLGFSWSFDRLREMMRFGLPLIPARIATYLIFYSDRYFINYFVGLSSLGIYAIGNKVATLLSLITAGFVTAWGPYVLNTYRQPDSRKTFNRVFRIYASLLFLVTVGLSVFCVELLFIFTTPDYIDAYSFTPYLAFSLLLYGIGFYFSVGIDITEKTYHRTWISGVTIILNPALNLLLIPDYGILGASIATLLSYIVYCYLSLIISERIYPVGYPITRYTLLLLSGGGIILLTFTLQTVALDLMQIAWKSVVMVLVVALPVLFNIVTPAELKTTYHFVRRRLARRKTTLPATPKGTESPS